MKVLIASLETSPLETPDVSSGFALDLQRELLALGHDARLALPYYGFQGVALRPVVEGVAVPITHTVHRADVKVLVRDGALVYVIRGHKSLSAGESHEPALIEWEASAFFCRAVLEALQTVKPAWIPDVIHAVGLSTALLPAYLRVDFASSAQLWPVPAVLTLSSVPASRRHARAQEEGRTRRQFLEAGLAFADEVIIAEDSEQAADDCETRLRVRGRRLGREPALRSIASRTGAARHYLALYQQAINRRSPRALAA